MRNYVSSLLVKGSGQKVDCGADFIGTGNITIAGWINAFDYGENSGGRIIDNGKFIVKMISPNQTITVYSDGSNNKSAATGAIPFGLWKFFAITRNTSKLVNFYINGALSGTADQDAGTPAGGTTNVIVGNNNALSRNFHGLMKELRIFNSILTLQQIQKLYQSNVVPSGLLVEYLMNENTGATVNDTSGNSRNGTITGASWSPAVPMKNRSLASGRISL